MPDSYSVSLYRPSRKKWITVLLSSLLFAAIGIWLVSDSPDFTEWLLVSFSIVFFGVSALLSMAVLIIPGSSFLMINPEGIKIRTLWFTKFYRWEEIESFGIDEVSTEHRGFQVSQKLVGFIFSPHYTGREETIFSRLNNRLGRAGKSEKFDETLPDTYGVDPEELARRLTNERKKFLN